MKNKQGGKLFEKVISNISIQLKPVFADVRESCVINFNKTKIFLYIFIYILYLPAELRAGRKEDELLETKNKQKAENGR